MPRPPKKNQPSGSGPGGRRGAKSAGRPRPAGKPGGRRGSAESSASNSKSPPGVERLQKVLAALGVASRRECEELIVEGRVEVDGVVVDELGSKVNPERQEIRVDGEVLRRKRRLYFAVNKPRGVVSTTRDPAGRPRVIDLLPPDAGRVFNVGRLDMESEGLILATNDGELANRLTHPSHGVEKIYHVQVAGIVEPDVLTQMRKGVRLAEAYVKPVDVRVKSHVKKSTVLEMTLDEGRNREIRRLLARVGHKVQKLTRVAVGPIRLGDMPPGAVRELTRDEVRKLEDAASDVPTRRPRRGGKKPGGRKPAGKPTASKKSASSGRAVIGGDDGESAAPPRRPAKSAGKPLRGAAGKKAAGKKPAGTKPTGKKSPGKFAQGGGRKSAGKPTGKPGKKGKRT